MRKILGTIFCLCVGGLLLAARADTFPLADGSSVSGDIIKITEAGLTFRQADATYTNLLWTKFSQDGLKQLSQNPKIAPLVEPFIIIPRPPKSGQAAISIQPVTRLDLPSKPSLFGGLLSSPVGLVLLLLFYVGNLYAGFEVAVCRNRPIALVMGLAAVLPVVGPVIFLSLPVPVEPLAEPPPEVAAAAEHSFTVPGMEPPQDEINIVAASWQPGTSKTPPQIFQRGQFTFNRRFFETRFPGFFGSVRGDEDRNKDLVLKATKGEYAVGRILSVTANDLQFETQQSGAKQEISLPFADIQEIKIITRDA